MAIATIYDLDGNIVCDGLQSGAVCNQAINRGEAEYWSRNRW